MTIIKLYRKVVCDKNTFKVMYINGKEATLTDSNAQWKVEDFRIVVCDTHVNIFIEVK